MASDADLCTPRNMLMDRAGRAFAVVGQFHLEDASVASLRYVTCGDRLVKAGPADIARLHECEPAYRLPAGDTVHTIVPHDRVVRTLDQFAGVGDLDEDERSLIDTLAREAGVRIGVTGSSLLGTARSGSDLDLTAAACDHPRLLATARILAERGDVLSPLTDTDWRSVYDKRGIYADHYPFKLFLAHERRKGDRWMAGPRRIDLLPTPLSRTVGPEDLAVYRLGHARVSGKVADGSAPYGHPAIYLLEDGLADLKDGRESTVEAVVCFTHTYAAQAFPGEHVRASGVLERYGTTAAGFEGPVLIVGTARDEKGEWLVSRELAGRTVL
ncbi:MAG: hypothetical protein QF415_13630 [Candidatus Undinarchaeales archaeon]|nr:hypothetical protein [Candidatus Undinarchaeales archaeon]MDP7494304.1 hypothetical protein [Candidatus Undinarchaeales archaeon]